MLSGSEVRLLADTLRILRLSNMPIESGRDSREFEDTSSSCSFFSFEIASGINCKNVLKAVSNTQQINIKLHCKY